MHIYMPISAAHFQSKFVPCIFTGTISAQGETAENFPKLDKTLATSAS